MFNIPPLKYFTPLLVIKSWWTTCIKYYIFIIYTIILILVISTKMHYIIFNQQSSSIIFFNYVKFLLSMVLTYACALFSIPPSVPFGSGVVLIYLNKYFLIIYVLPEHSYRMHRNPHQTEKLCSCCAIVTKICIIIHQYRNHNIGARIVLLDFPAILHF